MTIHSKDKLLDLAQRLPPGHNTVNGFIAVRGAAKFVEFLCAVFDGTETTSVRTPDRDGGLIHAEVRIGTATVMITDAKPDWPELHALTQVYVKDAAMVLRLAVEHGARIVTEPTPFYGSVHIARFVDPWSNLWWLYEPSIVAATPPAKVDTSSDPRTSWHSKEPSYVYRTLMDEMRELGARGTAATDGKPAPA